MTSTFSDMKRYRVAIVADFYLPQVGGLEVHMHDLARELTARGHHADIICVTPGGPDHDDFRVIRLPVPLAPFVQSIRDPKAIDALEKTLIAGKYDIIHAHNAFSPLAHVATYLAKKLGIPSIFTLHSVLRGYGSYLFRAIDQVFPWTQWPTILTGVSSFVAADLKQISGRNDIQVLLNATRVTDFPPSSQQEARVVTVMRCTKRKRPVDFVRMIPEVLARLPRGLWPKFTLVGDGPERPRAERIARRLGISEHIEFTGMLSRPAVRDILSRSSVFVLPSYLEALPIAVIEARSAGLPVVARIPNGVAEIIDHGINGLLAKNTEELVASVVTLLKDSTLRTKMALATREDLDRFTWQRSIERHERIYALAEEKHIIANRSSPSMSAPAPIDR